MVAFGVKYFSSVSPFGFSSTITEASINDSGTATVLIVRRSPPTFNTDETNNNNGCSNNRDSSGTISGTRPKLRKRGREGIEENP